MAQFGQIYKKKKNRWMLFLLLAVSFFLVSCTEKETTGTFCISYNGEVQQFDPDTSEVTGLIKNIESLAWLALRGGLEMELVDENLSEEDNTYISKSSNWESTENTDDIWLRISGHADDQGEGTSIPEHQDTLVYIQNQDMYIGIQNPDLKWDIWKLPEYGDWLEKEIKLFIRVATGL